MNIASVGCVKIAKIRLTKSKMIPIKMRRTLNLIWTFCLGMVNERSKLLGGRLMKPPKSLF